MRVSGVLVAELFMFMFIYVGTWLAWGTLAFKIIRRSRLIGWRAIAFGIAVTGIAAGIVSVSYILIQYNLIGKAPIGRAYFWMPMGLGMGCTYGTLNAEKRNSQDAESAV